MPRPWVKLYTQMLNEPWVIRLSDNAHRQFVGMLLQAGLTDDDGRVARVGDVTLLLRCADDDLTSALDELGDRIQERDGSLWIRDWYDWQPRRTDAERAADYRKRQRDGSDDSQETVTAPSRDASRNNHALDKIREEIEEIEEVEEELTPTASADKPPSTADWERILAPDVRGAYSGARIYKKRGDGWLAWWASVVNAARYNGLSPPEARREWREFVKSRDWQYAGGKDKCGESWGKWLAARQQKRSNGLTL